MLGNSWNNSRRISSGIPEKLLEENCGIPGETPKKTSAGIPGGTMAKSEGIPGGDPLEFPEEI